MFCLPPRSATAHPRGVPTCTLELKTIPNAPRTALVGWLGTALKVKVHAPALEGRANDELLDFLAGKLGVPRRALTLVRGEKSRHKVVRVDGLTLADTRDRLGVATPGGK
jgi:uncharacterized protein